jgi:integrase/recombinase XerC
MGNLPAVAGSASPAIQNDPLEQFLSGQLSERTRRAYSADLRHFFSFLGLQQVVLADLQAITFVHIVAFRNQLAAEAYKRINRKLSSLKALFKMLVAAGQIEKNPADSTLVRGYKIDETLSGKALSNQVLAVIQQAISEENNDLVRTRDSAIFQLLTFGGLRRSEVANMAWDDIATEGVFYILRLP